MFLGDMFEKHKKDLSKSFLNLNYIIIEEYKLKVDEKEHHKIFLEK